VQALVGAYAVMSLEAGVDGDTATRFMREIYDVLERAMDNAL
jgi:hypothetical protein